MAKSVLEDNHKEQGYRSGRWALVRIILRSQCYHESLKMVMLISFNVCASPVQGPGFNSQHHHQKQKEFIWETKWLIDKPRKQQRNRKGTAGIPCSPEQRNSLRRWHVRAQKHCQGQVGLGTASHPNSGQ